MAKSFKFKNSNYLDASGVSYLSVEGKYDTVKTVLDNIIASTLFYRGHRYDDMFFDNTFQTGIYTFSGYNGSHTGNPINAMDYGMIIIFEGSGSNYGVQLIFSLSQNKIWFRKHTELKIWGDFYVIK